MKGAKERDGESANRKRNRGLGESGPSEAEMERRKEERKARGLRAGKRISRQGCRSEVRIKRRDPQREQKWRHEVREREKAQALEVIQVISARGDPVSPARTANEPETQEESV